MNRRGFLCLLAGAPVAATLLSVPEAEPVKATAPIGKSTVGNPRTFSTYSPRPIAYTSFNSPDKVYVPSNETYYYINGKEATYRRELLAEASRL